MSDFTEPETLWESDRTFGEKAELIRLEKGEYNGKSTYSLRVLFKNRDGEWRWSQARADGKGRCWASLNLKAKELKELGEALLREANDERAGELRRQAERAGPLHAADTQSPSRPTRKPPAEAIEDGDIPF